MTTIDDDFVDTVTDLRAEVAGIRSEMRQGFAEMRAGFADLRAGIAALAEWHLNRAERAEQRPNGNGNGAQG